MARRVIEVVRERRSKYDFVGLSDGWIYEVDQLEDYDFGHHEAFASCARHWAADHDVRVRLEKRFEGHGRARRQVGFSVQFFWDLTHADPPPKAFRPVPEDHEGPVPWGPTARAATAA